MATHMQAVETYWIFEYTGNTFPYRMRVDDPNKIQETLQDLKVRGIETVKMTEVRTCSALPGMKYTINSTFDLTGDVAQVNS